MAPLPAGLGRARAVLLVGATGLLVVATGASCTTEEWRNADFQIDVIGAEATDQTRVRICVTGVGVHEEAVGAGRIGFTGIPVGGPWPVVVQELWNDGDDGAIDQVAGVTEPVEIGGGAVVQEAGWLVCEAGDVEGSCAPCTAEGGIADQDQADWLLAVRFVTAGR